MIYADLKTRFIIIQNADFLFFIILFYIKLRTTHVRIYEHPKNRIHVLHYLYEEDM